MSDPRSAFSRFFGWIWLIFIAIYRVIIIVSVVLTIYVVWSATRGGAAVAVEKNEPLTLIPTGALVEQTDNTSRGLVRELSSDRPSQTRLRDLTDALDAARMDARIPFAVIKLDEMQGAGLPQLQEVANAMKKFRAAGKPIYAFGESFDQNQYYLASQADEVSLDPMGSVSIEGFSVYTNFFKDALDKLGVQINVFRVGEFKSAVEPFLRNDMSPEAKLADQAWLSDLWSTYNSGVSEARKLPDNSADTYARGFSAGLLQNQGDAAKFALASKLVTRIETQADFRKRMAEKVGYDKDKVSFRQIDFTNYLRAVHHESHKKTPAHKVGLVVVQGEIVDGESDDSSAGGDTISELLDRARRDDDVEAVVLRVNSPGGSVFASEKIRRAVQQLEKDGKPVVASMSTLAASGGYWISMNANKIWAEPSTITGSIGIFGLIPTIDQPLAKLGIHTDGVGTTPLAGAFRLDRPLTPDERTIVQAQIDKGYRDFTEGVAGARKLPLEKVQNIARGRVWSGTAAKSLGLVDELGGFDDAVAAAAKLAELKPDTYQIYEFEPDTDWYKQVFGKFFSQSEFSSRMLQALLPQSLLRTQLTDTFSKTLHHLNDPRGEYAYCFCQPSDPQRAR